MTDAANESRVRLRNATEKMKKRTAQIRLNSDARSLLLGVYRGRVTSIPCDDLGDKSAYDRATGTWKNVGQISALGRAWYALENIGLIADYDSFGGYHYCKITKAGEVAAGRLIANKRRAPC